MSAVLDRPPAIAEQTVVPFKQKKRKAEPFVAADDGLPVYTGDNFEDDWDEVANGIEVRHWSLAAIAASLEVRRGSNTMSNFAYEKRTSARYVRGLAKTYRAFENGRRLPSVSFWHHYEAASAENPVRAVNFAHDRDWSTRQLKRWIRLGEPEMDPFTDAVVRADPETEEFQDQDVEDESILIPDIELAMRGLKQIRAQLKSTHIARYIDGDIEELDWELIEITKAPSKVSQRVLSLVLGGCGTREMIAQRAKLSVPDTDRHLAHWQKEGRIEEREVGGRKKGQRGCMGTFWVEVGTPLGSDLYIDPQLGVEHEDWD